MIAYENPEKTGIEAGCFGSEKKNSFIEDCLGYYKDRAFIKNDGSFDILPLPKIMLKFLSAHQDVMPYDWHYFTNKSYHTGKISTTEKSYSIHRFACNFSLCTPENIQLARTYFSVPILAKHFLLYMATFFYSQKRLKMNLHSQPFLSILLFRKALLSNQSYIISCIASTISATSNIAVPASILVFCR